MSLPDEENVIEMLRQIKRESVPPRQDWKRIGKERLVRQATNIQRRTVFFRASAYVGTLAAAALVGVFIISEQYDQKSEASQLLHTSVESKVQEHSSVVPDKEDSVDQQKTNSIKQAETPILSEQSPSKKESEEVNAQKVEKEQTIQTAPSWQSQIAVSRDKTKMEEQAEKYLLEQLGEQAKQYQIDPANSKLQEGYITFRRVILGIPLQENSTAVKVNQYSGEMSLLLYPEVEQSKKLSLLPKPTDLIDKTKAARGLAAGLQLVYAGKDQQTLQYMPNPNMFIDAKTGKLVTNGTSDMKVIAAKGLGKRLTIKDRNKAANVMHKEFGINVTGEASINIEKQAISFTWWTSEMGTVKLLTDDEGTFIGYSVKEGFFKQASKPVSTLLQAQAIALAKLAIYLPSNVQEVTLQATKQEPDLVHFTFLPMYQGIPVIDYPYVVTVEMTSGMVISMEGIFSQKSFKLPDKTEAISLEEAASHFVKEAPLELVYLTNRNRPMLVYQIRMDSEKPWAIDAVTGKKIE